MDRRLRAAITLFFLVSGATALVYQVIWIRTLSLRVGHSAMAVAIVVATFMAGLGLGARLAGLLATRVRRPLLVYGVLEVAVGLLALSTPWTLGGIEPLVAAAGIGALYLPGAFLAAVLVLLPPTTAMGATLPLLTRWYARDAGHLGRDMGWLYAVNTTGAFLGAGLAGFVLLPGLGQPLTLGLAGAANLAIGIGAILLGRHFPLGPDQSEETSSSRSSQPSAASDAIPADDVASPLPAPLNPYPVLLAFALSGAAAMANQVAWTRSFELFTGSATYAFSLIVCAFIAGLALGGHLFGRVIDRVRDRAGLLAAVNLGIALSAALLVPVLGELPLWLVGPIASLHTFGGVQAFVFVVLFLLVFLPTVLMGGTYAVATRALTTTAAEAPRVVGRAYAWNTGGAILGSLFAGLVLIPLLQLRGVLWLAIGLNLAASAVLLARRRSLALLLPGLALLGALASPAWNPRHLNIAPYLYAADLARDPAGLRAQSDSGSVLFHEEGIGATVTVIGHSDGSRVLRINGKTDASTDMDRLTQSFLGYLPLLLSRNNQRAMTIGLGSGMSLAALLEHPVKQVEVVELLPEVVTAARQFASVLSDPLGDLRVRLELGDGRHFLAYSGQRFDAIVSHPTNLFISGISTLFTEEAFQAMHRALEPGGVALVWIQGYLLRDEDFRTILRTFLRVFPETHLWNAGPFDLMLTGHLEPLKLDAGALADRISGISSGTLNGPLRIHHAADLQRHYLFGPEMLRKLAGEGRVQTDRDPFLEFSAPRGLYGGQQMLDVAGILNLRQRMPTDRVDPILEAGIDSRLAAQTALTPAFLGTDIPRLRTALAADPDHPFARERLARLVYSSALASALQGDLPGAETGANEVLALAPASEPAMRLLARVRDGRGDQAGALELLTRARDLHPEDPYAELALGQYLRKIGKAEEAARAFEAARVIDPGLPELQP